MNSSEVKFLSEEPDCLKERNLLYDSPDFNWISPVQISLIERVNGDNKYRGGIGPDYFSG